MSFISSCKTNLGFSRVLILESLEYRLNFFLDACLQPLLYALVELAFWLGIFHWSQGPLLNGHSRESFMAYALFIPFFTRISTNWMLEMRMVNDVETGRINSLLVRPTSIYQVYLSQLLGYKFVTAAFSLWIPILMVSLVGLPLQLGRLPLALVMLALSVVLTFNMGYIIAGLGFYFTRVNSFTVMKNMLLWVLAGEVMPVDALPAGFREVVLHLPFISGGYLPVAYVIGRVNEELMYQGFLSLLIGLIVTGAVGGILWKRGLRVYTGTGA